jgi:hypothetical protein
VFFSFRPQDQAKQRFDLFVDGMEIAIKNEI